MSMLREGRRHSCFHGDDNFGLLFFAALLVIVLFPSHAKSATRTWDGGGADNNWSTAANWDGNITAPVSNDALVFPVGALRLANINNISSGTNFQSLTFQAGGYTISGNDLTINNSAGITVPSGAFGTITISLNVNLSAAQTWTVTDSFATLIVSSVISGSSSSHTLTKAGAGTLTLSSTSSNTFTGKFTVNAGVVQLFMGSGTTGTNAFGGQLDINGGTVLLLRSNQIPRKRVVINAPGILDLNGFTDTIGALTMTGGTLQTGMGIYIPGGGITTNPSSVPALISGNMMILRNRTFLVNNGTASDDLLITAQISGSRNITKTGSGTLAMSGNNTYTRTTLINAGTVVAAANNALGAVGAGASTTVASGATLAFRGGIAYSSAEAVTINGTGYLGLGAMNNISGANSFAGAVTLTSVSTINAEASTLTLTGTVANGGFLLSTGGAGNLTANGLISGTGGITAGGSGTVTLGAANTYSGGTTVNSGTLLVTNAIGSATGSGTVTVNSGGSFGGANASGITGVATVNNGATLTPGTAGAGTLKTGSLILNATSNLNFDLGASADQTQVTGNLTLDGVLNVPTAGFTAGIYTLFTYTGSLTNNTVSFGAMPGERVYAIDTATAGQVKLITSPTVLSIVKSGADPTNAASVNFTVTFSDSVTGVDMTDFTLTTTGVSGASVGTVTPVSGSVYTVAVNTGSGSGTIRLDVSDNNSIVSGGQPLGGPAALDGNFISLEFFTIDKTAPTVLSVNRAGLDPTGEATVDFTVTFIESVTGVDALDFFLTVTGVIGTAITGVTGSGLVYTVTVNTGSGDGTMRLDVTDDDSVIDFVGNSLGGAGVGNGSFTTGQIYTINKTSPSATMHSTTTNITNVSPIPITVIFTEAVIGFTASDVIASNATVSNFSGSFASYSFDLTPIVNGLVTADILAGAAVDIDNLGNLAAPQFQRTYDAEVPSVSASSRSGTSPTNANNVNFTVTFSESVTGVDSADFSVTVGGTISGISVSGVTGSGTIYTVTVNTGTGSGTVRLDITDNDTIVDLAGNKLGGVGLGNGNFTTGQFFVIDKTAPTIAMTSTAISPTNVASFLVTVTFSEAVIGFTSSDIAIVNGSQSGFAGSGASYSLTLSPVANGLVTMDISAGVAVDAVGNGNLSAPQFQRTYDTLIATVLNVDTSVPNGPYGLNAVIPIRVTFDEAISVIGTITLTLETGTSDAVVGYSSGSGTATLIFNYTVTVGHTSADLDYVSTTALALNGGTITDLAGNTADLTLPLPGAGNIGSLADNNDIVINSNAAAVTNVTSTATDGTYGAGVTIPIVLTFSKLVNVTGTPQVTLDTSSTPNAIVNYSSGSGSTALTFNYTIAAGQESLDLDYLSEVALTLNGGTINDAFAVPAVLTLPEPGATGSLGANKAIIIDTAGPNVSNVAGVVFSDVNRNGAFDLAESGILSVTVQIFAMPANSLVATETTTATGDYTFIGIANGSYEIRETAPANYTPTTPTTLAITVNNADITGQNFGNFAGTKITGVVFLDIGSGGGIPNNGILEGAESGINGVTVKATDTGGGTVYDQTVTSQAGAYTLWVPTTVTISVVVRETNPINYVSTTPDTISLSASPGVDLPNNHFGDVPPLSFSPNGNQTAAPGGVVMFAHTIVAGTAGQITLSTTTTQGLLFTFYKDANGNAQIDTGEPILTAADLNLTANQTLKFVSRTIIPSNKVLGTMDTTVITALQAFVNASLTDMRSAIDITTVSTGTLRLIKNGSVTTAKPGDPVVYTLTYTNIGAETLTTIVLYDRLSEYLLFVSSLPPQDAGFPDATGVLRWTISGTLLGGSGGSLSYTVTVK